MANIQPNIPLIPNNYYNFNYDGSSYSLQYVNQDDAGLHFLELAHDITWDFIIPPDRIASVVFSEDTEGHTDVEDNSQVAGRIKTKKNRKNRKSKKGKKTRKYTKKYNKKFNKKFNKK